MMTSINISPLGGENYSGVNKEQLTNDNCLSDEKI